MFEPVRTRHTFEEAAEQIAGKVRAGELRQGDKLPAERDLAVLMEISRPTLYRYFETDFLVRNCLSQ